MLWTINSTSFNYIFNKHYSVTNFLKVFFFLSIMYVKISFIFFYSNLLISQTYNYKYSNFNP